MVLEEGGKLGGGKHRTAGAAESFKNFTRKRICRAEKFGRESTNQKPRQSSFFYSTKLLII